MSARFPDVPAHKELTGMTVFRPFDIHRTTIVLLTRTACFLCQFPHFFVGEREMSRCSRGHIFNLHLLAVLPGGGVNHGFSTPWCGVRWPDGLAAGCHGVPSNCRTTIISPSPHAEVIKTTVKAGFGIDRRTSPRRGEIGANHPLRTPAKAPRRDDHIPVNAIRDGAIKQRSKYAFHCHQYRIEALNVKKRFLLARNEASGISSAVAEERTGKRVFSSSGRKLRIGIADGAFPAPAERSASITTGDSARPLSPAGETSSIIRLIQQLITRWFTPLLDPKRLKRIGSGCKTILERSYAHAGKG